MLLDDLLDLLLNVGRDLARRDLLQQRLLRAAQVRAELKFPPCDLVDGDRVELQ